jgi:hypothetical protein
MTKFLSRKFIVTMSGMLLGSALAFLGKTGAEGVLVAGIAAYNGANFATAWVHARNGSNGESANT